MSKTAQSVGYSLDYIIKKHTWNSENSLHFIHHLVKESQPQYVSDSDKKVNL